LSDFISVNGESVDFKNAVLRSNFRDGNFMRETVEDLLVRDYAKRNDISATDQELQVAADEYRYMRNLESVEDLERWLAKNHLTLEAAQDGIESILLRNKVMYAIPAKEMEAYFAEHQLDFERVELYSIRCENQEKAAEIGDLAREDPAAFHALAMEHSADEDTRPMGGFVGSVARNEVTGEIEAAIFGVAPGTVVGPVKTDKGYNVFKVGTPFKPTMEKELETIRTALFESLLTRLRSEAKITISI
jgi:parvulin-like peptidyl-prolyl isomerase